MSTPNISIQSILEITTEYSGRRVYIQPIPDKLQARVRRKFKLPRDETIVAYMDFTLIGYARQGIAIAAGGLYLRKTFIPWEEFVHMKNIHRDEYYIIFNDKVSIIAYGCPLPKDTMLAFLWKLQKTVIGDSVIEGQTNIVISSELTLKEAVMETLRPYETDKVYIGEIPTPVISKIRSNSRLAVLEGLELWAFFDCSITGKGKEGVAIAEDGIHWRIAGFGLVSIPWYVLINAEFTLPKSKNIYLNGIKELFTGTSPIAREKWMHIMTTLKTLPQLANVQSPVSQKLETNTATQLDELFIEAICWRNAYFDKLHDYALNPRKSSYIEYSFTLPDNEPIVAYKSTASGSSNTEEYGFMLTNRLIYIRNSPDSGAIGTLLLPIAELEKKTLVYSEGRLLLDSVEIFNSSDSLHLYELLEDLQLYVESLRTPANPSIYPYDPHYIEQWSLPVQGSNTARWIVAEDGMLRGVFDETEIRWAAETGQLNRMNTMLWQKGLTEWVPADESELFNDRCEVKDVRGDR